MIYPDANKPFLTLNLIFFVAKKSPYLGPQSPYQKLQISLFEPKKISHVWLPCKHNSLYNFMPIFMQLCTSFFHGLKMCMWFRFNPAINFCHFSTLYILSLFHFVYFVIFRRCNINFTEVRSIFCYSIVHYKSHLMTKPTKWLCAQRRLRSAWASAFARAFVAMAA